jgi:CheY-like chemotaxis protein
LITSRPPVQFTDFVIRRRAPSNSEVKLGACRQGIGAKVSTVLVVDDDPGTRSLLRLILETDGHAVIEAAHGGEALDIIRPNALPDVLVTDLMMPILSGLELIERLQLEPITATIPIVVVSSNPQAAQALATSGVVTAVVRKPFVAAAFAECIRAIASGPMKTALP